MTRRYSASRIGAHMECQLAAKYKYEDNLPRKVNAKMVFGSIIHVCLQHYYESRGDHAGADRMFCRMWANPAKAGYPIDYWPKYTSFGTLMGKGRDILRYVHDTHRWQDFVVLATEAKFLVPIGEFELTGFIDLLGIEKSGTGTELLKIIDFKTASKSPNLSQLALDVQLTVYDYAVSQREFWVGVEGNPEYPGLENGEWLWETVGKSIAHRCIWWGVWTQRQIDAGPRNKRDHERLYRVMTEIEKSIKAGVAVPKIGEACNWCLSGDTEIVTSGGVKPIQALAGTAPEVLTNNNGSSTFVRAPIRCFGEQELYNVTFTKGRARKTVQATADHRWLVRKYRNSTLVTTRTTGLIPGQWAPYNKGIVRSRVRPSAFGIASGIVFGDGTRHRVGTAVPLYGDKIIDLIKWFPLSPTRQAGDALEVLDLPDHFKDLPSLKESKSYLFGWLAGYFATDGTITTAGQVTISSARREHLEFVRDLGFVLGIGTFTITQHERLGRGTMPTLLYRIQLANEDLGEDFFLRPHHLERYQQVPAVTRHAWRVLSVESAGVRAPVYCATVPDTHNFTLDGGLVTGNCDYQEPCALEIPVAINQLADQTDPNRWI
jgi:hypothetical protein